MPYAYLDNKLPAQLIELPDRGNITQENVPVGVCDNTMYLGQGSHGFPLIMGESMDVKSMSFWVGQASGSMRLAIWDEIGTLKGFTDLFTPVEGINNVPLTGGFGIPVIGGNFYYVGMYISDATGDMRVVGYSKVYSAVPSIPYVSLFAAGDVDSVMGSNSNITDRPWIALIGESV